MSERVPYGQGTETEPCDECHATPSRHCCFWQDDEPAEGEHIAHALEAARTALAKARKR